MVAMTLPRTRVSTAAALHKEWKSEMLRLCGFVRSVFVFGL